MKGHSLLSPVSLLTPLQDLKDFARQSGLDVVYSEVNRERDPTGNGKGFVEYETAADLASAVEKLDGHDFKGGPVTCISDVGTLETLSHCLSLTRLIAAIRDPSSSRASLPLPLSGLPWSWLRRVPRSSHGRLLRPSWTASWLQPSP